MHPKEETKMRSKIDKNQVSLDGVDVVIRENYGSLQVS